jgi:hypothetical protein
MTQKKKGRPFSIAAKTEHVRIRVTKAEKEMLKGVKMSSAINSGLMVILPTLGIYNAKDKTWSKYLYKGESEKQLAWGAINMAANRLSNEKEPTTQQLMLMALLMRQRNELENFSATSF